MAKVKLQILHNGKPLVGAEVTIGARINGITGVDGRIEGNTPLTGWAIKMLLPIRIEKVGVLAYGSTLKLEKDVETVLEV